MDLYSQSYIVEFNDNTRALVLQNIRHVTVLYKEHVVVAGETLYIIANRYYQDTTDWYVIAEANDIVDPVVLIPGTTLIIPIDGKNSSRTIL